MSWTNSKLKLTEEHKNQIAHRDKSTSGSWNGLNCGTGRLHHDEQTLAEKQQEARQKLLDKFNKKR